MKKKWLMLPVAVGAIVFAVGGFFYLAPNPLRAPARRQWKVDAVYELSDEFSIQTGLNRSCGVVTAIVLDRSEAGCIASIAGSGMVILLSS
jgi:hypothetical protein